jgi:hypothetical protein
MKTMMFVIVITLILAISVSIAGDKISIDPVVGIWVNTDYDKIGKWGKFIIKPDFAIEAFDDPARKPLPATYTFIVDESWADAEGNIYYKVTIKRPGFGRITYELWKLDTSQTVFESMAGAFAVEHPKEIKPGHGSYNIHYRQE